jgi:hypothetical protein
MKQELTKQQEDFLLEESDRQKEVEEQISIFEMPKEEISTLTIKRKDTLLWVIQYVENDIKSLNEDLKQLKILLRRNEIKVFNTTK